MNTIHHPDQKKFSITLEDKQAYLLYKEDSSGVLNYYSTFTPDELRGQGLAGKITKQALEYAKKMGFKVIPGCPYVKSYIDRHPEYQALLS